MPSRSVILICLIFLGFTIPCDGQALDREGQDLDGQWYGAGWDATNEYNTTNVDIAFDVVDDSGTADVYIPVLGLFHAILPVSIVGDAITIGNPAVFGLTGTIAGQTMTGDAWQSGALIGTWYLEQDLNIPTNPGPAPGPPCDDLPPLLCTGGADYCAELIPFEPDEGPGYWDYPIPGETAADQCYSYLRRDAVMLIKYAAAKVACKAADWDYGNFAPLGLGDMSEADGSTPGTNIGQLRHPPGTHEDGKDIDAAYYQLFSPDDLIRPVGDSFIGTEDQYHLIGPPYALDQWRTALFIAYLSEHPHLRVVGVDGRIGLVLEPTLNQLLTLGWIDQELYDSIPLAYEVTDQGHGWYLFHHHHMHISMEEMTTGAPELEQPVAGAKLLGSSPNPFNPRTTVTFMLAEAETVTLGVYDIAGRLVRVLLDGEAFTAGTKALNWDGRDDAGERLSSGVYLLRLQAGSALDHGKVTMLK